MSVVAAQALGGSEPAPDLSSTRNIRRKGRISNASPECGPVDPGREREAQPLRDFSHAMRDETWKQDCTALRGVTGRNLARGIQFQAPV